MSYFSGECVTNIAKIALNKPLGLQILYVATTIGNVLTYYFCEYRRKSGDIDAENVVETHYEQLVNNVENILNKMAANNNDLTIISNYLELVNRCANNALGQILDLAICDHNQAFSLKTPYNNPIAGLRDQKDGTAPITRIRKLCRLLDLNVANQLVNTPYDMWQAVLDARMDKFDEIVDDFYNAIINCGNLALSTVVKGRRSYNYYNINFNINIIPPDNIKIIEHKFRVYPNSTNIIYIIPLFVNFYEYFNVVDDKETKIMVENRLRLAEQVEKCLENMKRIVKIKRAKENIKVTIKDC